MTFGTWIAYDDDMRTIRLSRKPFAQREREALLESIRQLELDLHEKRIELRKSRREVAALRLLAAIHKVREDSRVSTTASMDEEMANYIFEIVRDREIEMLPYSTARDGWEMMKRRNQ